MMAAGLLTAYVADCVVTPLHAAGYRAHEPSSEAFAALIVLMMPASAPYYMVVTATIIAVLVKEAFGGEGHYPFHPAAVGLVAATLALAARHVVLPGTGYSAGTFQQHRSGAEPKATTPPCLPAACRLTVPSTC